MRVFFLKCTSPIPSCTSGLDHICSDGKCYSQNGCPMGTSQVSSGSCTCSTSCNSTESSLQVNLKTFLITYN